MIKVRTLKIQKKRENAMVEIATKLGITTEDVGRHYKSQRSNFGKYLNSLEVPSGSSRDKVKLDPEQEHLRWLICHIAPRTTKTSMQKETGGYQQYHFYYHLHSTGPGRFRSRN